MFKSYKLLLVSLFLIFSFFNLMPNEKQKDNKLKVVVLPFFSNDNNDKSYLDLLTKNFTISLLIGSNKFTYIERKQFNNLNNLKINNKSDSNISNAVEIGKLLGAEIVIINSLNNIENNYFISTKVIKVEIGEILFEKNDKTSNKKEIITLVNKLAKSIIINENDINNNQKISITNNFNFDKNEANFINDFYIKHYGMSIKYINNYEKSIEMYRIFGMLGGIFIVLGGILQVSGFIITMVDYLNNHAPIMGFTCLSIGTFIIPFSSIPLWIMYMIGKIYQKITGKKLVPNKANIGMDYTFKNEIRIGVSIKF
ncbi:MAG: hypothetical protein A2086_14730 [Spirochaetes bacterium GWD1_27_9]|nr:MAG: hypothetical protein A2Z98_10010 [Spirochaetes bacterium GWB1_27_13]OHD21092.1 MAG: hypothetical protein A2Y34_06270 [Spirochaetes bacterium GWC1_27_15]OHD34751.1 MAG: hypothetical protein A2086_14730 [Spirochaetes bacterium GWD1_27_9]